MRLFLLLSFLVACVAAASALQCVNEHGKNVDWFIAIKLPKVTTASDPGTKGGYSYLYLDADRMDGLIWSPNLLTDTDGALFHLLGDTFDRAHAYSPSGDFGWFFYNDQRPNNTKSSTRAHAKGVVAFDAHAKTGYWLIHSTPRFPNYTTADYSFPDYEATYGQSYLCLSVGADQLETIGGQLEVAWPWIYDGQFPASFEKLAPTLFAVWKSGKHITTPATSEVSITTLGGQKFAHFAKNSQWDADLYEDLVAAALDVPLITETWMRPEMDSYCHGVNATSGYTVENSLVLDPSFGADAKHLSYSYTKDHSKWAVTNDDAPYPEGLGAGTSRHPVAPRYACIGDINRQESQRKRGGGTACILDESVWFSLRSLVAVHDACPDDIAF
jgi:deoxyribonuclease-2